MRRPEEQRWNLGEIAEAFEATLLPEEVAVVMKRFTDRQQAEKNELERMLRMVAIISEYDEAMLLNDEGGSIVRPDGMLGAASRYLDYLYGRDFKNELDRKARLLSLYIMVTLDNPYGDNDSIAEILEPVSLLLNEVKCQLDREGYKV